MPQPKRVVFIDDELHHLFYYIEETESAGYAVQQCHSAEEGLNYIRERYPEIDVVILDMRMPSPRAALDTGVFDQDETGLWLLSEARDIIEQNRLPIIVLSNRASPSLVTQIEEMFSLPNGLVIVTSKNIETTAVMLPGLISRMCARWKK